ncbi:MAG: hypothetical protein ABI683_09940 [Ginsengibacter sp.]
MEINRNNYEEYFLLYADNELTDNEKIEVLKFIRENKDLENEFKTIQDTICKPDNIVMQDKSSLLRATENDFVTEKNYEEIFVLYHDNELGSEEKTGTELFLRDNPHLRKEFDFIGRAKLTPDKSITFPRKKDLYHKEKDGRVIPIAFWRSLAAAMFIGFGLWIFETYREQPAVPQTAVIKKDNAQGNKQSTATTNIDKTIEPTKKDKDSFATSSRQNQNIADNNRSVEKKEVLKQVKQNQQQKNSYAQQTPKQNDKAKTEMKVIVTKEASSDKAQTELASLENDLKNIPQNKKIDAADIAFTGDVEIKPTQKDNVAEQPAMQSQQASYVTDANQKNENYVFYNVTTEEFRKSKVGGFLKKVKRIVERNNPVTRLFAGEEKQVASN